MQFYQELYKSIVYAAGDEILIKLFIVFVEEHNLNMTIIYFLQFMI